MCQTCQRMKIHYDEKYNSFFPKEEMEKQIKKHGDKVFKKLFEIPEYTKNMEPDYLVGYLHSEEPVENLLKLRTYIVTGQDNNIFFCNYDGLIEMKFYPKERNFAFKP